MPATHWGSAFSFVVFWRSQLLFFVVTFIVLCAVSFMLLFVVSLIDLFAVSFIVLYTVQRKKLF